MAKFSTIICILVLFCSPLEEKMVTTVEAKDCHKVWTCKGDQRCWDDCKNNHKGKGMCDLYTAPSVPKQCFCAYKC
ncbi:hypothetical protein UlMin_030115 [Ulmus minor]